MIQCSYFNRQQRRNQEKFDAKRKKQRGADQANYLILKEIYFKKGVKTGV
jgi:hypothetical protein